MLVNLPVIAKAFANADGMSKFLLSTGLVHCSDSLTEFAKGFSQAFATSDFVLVGHGKDPADKKIKGEGWKRPANSSKYVAYKDRYFQAVHSKYFV